MRVLFHIADGATLRAFSRDLELIQKHQNSGDEIFVLRCAGEQKVCHGNGFHEESICEMCRYRVDKGLKLLGIRDEKIFTVHIQKYVEGLNIPKFQDIEDLKSYKRDGIPHGMASASFLITTLRNPKPNMKDNRDLVKKNLKTSIGLYHSSMEVLSDLKPDLVYFMNGRGAYSMSFSLAARELGIKTIAHEIGHTWDTYITVEGESIHDLESIKKTILEYWEKNTNKNKIEIGKKFFEDRRYGNNFDEDSRFTSNQVKGKLPENFDPKKRNIAIFNSSEDEYAAISDYENSIYKDQIDGLEKIINSSGYDEQIHFYLRIHPNLTGLDNYQTRKFDQLTSPNLTKIPADEDISTYALMENCEKVITFGSTMGIESVYWQVPSILLGRAAYEDLNVCYIPSNHKKTIQLINDKLAPKHKINAIKFGYFKNAALQKFKYYQPKPDKEGEFNGHSLAVPKLVALKTAINEKLKKILIKKVQLGKVRDLLPKFVS